MKKTLLFFILTLVCLKQASAQISLGLEINRFDYKSALGATFKYDYRPGDFQNLKFQWNAGVGIADESGFYIRFPGGIPLSGILLASWIVTRTNSSDKFGTIAGLIVCAIPAILPNRISYTVLRTEKSAVAFYAEPINLCWWHSSVEKKLSYAPQAGVTFNIGGIMLEGSAIYQVNVKKLGLQFGASYPIRFHK